MCVCVFSLGGGGGGGGGGGVSMKSLASEFGISLFVTFMPIVTGCK